MKTINLGILAHVDAGKTTIVEQLLYHTGEIKSAGSVNGKNTRSDWLTIERERGISVRASSVVLHIGDTTVNIIDTPGHMDFIGEVEHSLAVMDAVIIVVSALEGIQSQTEILWKAARALSLPTIFFINKADRAGCDLDVVTAALKAEFSSELIALNGVINAGTRDCEIVKSTITEDEILCLCDYDEKLSASFLSAGRVSKAEFSDAFCRAAKKGLAFPLVFGAASLGKGIADLINAIADCFPINEENPDASVSGRIFKVEHDKGMGKIAHIRLFSGCIKSRDQVRIVRGDESIYEKVTQIREVNGARYKDVGVVRGGDIAAIYGLVGAKAGDIIGEITERLQYKMAEPLFLVQASVVPGEKQTDLLKAVQELSDEYPSLDYMWVSEERELTLKIMGEIQTEVLAYLIKERYNLDVVFMPPTVIYKETPLKTGIGYERYTMPKPCWAVVKLQLEPLPRGSGFEFQTAVDNNDIFLRYQNHVKASVPETLKQGLYGWEVVDLRVTLIGGEHHTVHTHPMDFFLATPIAVMDGLTNCKTQLLEPILKMYVTAGEEFSGRIIGDILAMRGSFDSPVIINGKTHIEALVPVSASLDYPLRLSSMTGGKGTIKTTFYGYRECDLELGAIAKRRGVNPLDRAKWILYKRNALGI